jgi:DNA sulfur modification protein DndE
MIKNFVLASVFILSLFESSQRPVHVFMIGDSTMANKEIKAEPERGWGQMLTQFFGSGVLICNHAQNGRSSKSFIDEGRWKNVMDSLQTGDYVIIQFGHNDSKADSAKHTDPRTSYRANLIRFITETRSKGATPILCTSIVRRKFDDKGQLTDTHGEYPVVTREIAKEFNVPLIDLQKKTEKLVSELGPEKSITLFVYTLPGEYPNRPTGTKDDTHLNKEGSTKVAALAVDGMKEINLPLVKFLK